jgi:hypothetical protein
MDLRQYPGITNPTVEEALGAWQAVVLCSNLGLQHLNLEGDSMLIVSALNGREPCWSSYGHLIEDTRLKLQLIFLFCASKTCSNRRQ